MLTMRLRQHCTTAITIGIITVIGISLSCKKGPSEYLYVSQKEGVSYYVPGEPGYANAPYGQIPCGDKIGIFSRKTEKGVVWVETEMYGKKGWLPESALTADQGSVKCAQPEAKGAAITPGPVIAAPTVEEAAKKFYHEHYKKVYGDLQKQFPDNYTDAKIATIIGKIDSKGITVRSKDGNYAVVTHGAPVGDMEVIEKADALWQKWENGWREYVSSDEWGDTIHLGHINDDSFPDALFVRCVSDMCTITVYLGKDDSSMTVNPEQFNMPETPGFTVKLDRCGGSAIQGGGKSLAIFDCARNRLIAPK